MSVARWRAWKSILSIALFRVLAAGPFIWEYPDGRSATLDLYGIQGERIRGLFSGQTFGQTRTIGWDGRDENGGLVPAGVYFAALHVDGLPARARRIVVVR
jgi:hypothetical protein